MRQNTNISLELSRREKRFKELSNFLQQTPPASANPQELKGLLWSYSSILNKIALQAAKGEEYELLWQQLLGTERKINTLYDESRLATRDSRLK